MGTITAADAVLTRVAPVLRRLGATSIEVPQIDTIVATFRGLDAPAARASLRDMIDGVRLLVRSADGPIGTRAVGIDELGGFLSAADRGPAWGFSHATHNPTTLTIEVSRSTAEQLRQVVRPVVDAPGPIEIRFGDIMLPIG